MEFLAGLLAGERARRGTRGDTRSLSCRGQAILVLRRFLDGTRMNQLARDNAIGRSTGYEYLHEGIDVLAGRAPGLHGALLAAKAAGYSHVNIDGKLVETDRCRTPGPAPGVDLWWSGKHDNHRGNVQVVTVADGWPIWTSDVRPGREHDTTALRTLGEVPPALAEAGDDLRALGDQGYEGDSGTITVAFRKPKGGRLPLSSSSSTRPTTACERSANGQRAAEDNVQGPTQRQPGPVADREDRRRSARHPPRRPRPHHMTAFGSQTLTRNGSMSRHGRCFTWLSHHRLCAPKRLRPQRRRADRGRSGRNPLSKADSATPQSRSLPRRTTVLLPAPRASAGVTVAWVASGRCPVRPS